MSTIKIKLSKKYTSTFRNMAFGGSPEAEVLAAQKSYDEKGNVIEEYRHDDSEGKNEKNIYSYNDQGLLTVQELHLLDEGIHEKFTYIRDDKGRVTEYCKYYSDEEGEKVIYSYLDHEHPVKIERYDSDGEPETLEQLTYNDRKLVIGHEVYGPDGILIEKTTIEYNENDLPVSRTTVNEEDELIQSTELKYNENKDVIRVTERNESGKIISDVASVYDSRGNVTERIVKDFHSRKICFEYDEHDNCVTEELYDEHGNLAMKSTYEYDQHQNLIHETRYLLDSSRSGRNGNLSSRYEYEYW